MAIDPIGAFMRKVGLKLFYFVFTAGFTFLFHYYIVEDGSKYPTPPHYPWPRQLWLWVNRIYGMIILIPSLIFLVTYFFCPLPPVPDQETRDFSTRQDIIDDPNRKKRRIKFMIIRIITRGDYPEMIRRNVTHHIRLFELYANFDRLEAHIVTENQLEGDYSIGKMGRIREIRVPSDYKAASGALYKARNMNYWMYNYPEDIDQVPDEDTWILSLDEDAFMDETWVKDFMDNFLDSGAHCTVNPTIIDLPKTASWVTGFEESWFFTFESAGMWLEGAVLKKMPIWFRGSAYMVRRDAEKAVGYDYNPAMSVSEDQSFCHLFANTQYKVGYVHGWNWEWGAPDLLGLIKQRARWFRGHIYSASNVGMSLDRRFGSMIRFFYFYIIHPPLMINTFAPTFTWLILWYPSFWIPAGSRIWVDYVICFAFCNYMYAIIYGAWHITTTKRAVLYTLATSCWVGVVGTFIIHLIEQAWALVVLADDYIRGTQRYEFTEKKTK